MTAPPTVWQPQVTTSGRGYFQLVQVAEVIRFQAEYTEWLKHAQECSVCADLDRCDTGAGLWDIYMAARTDS
ncbi:hypothetical protein KQY30_20230 [Streptomyces sp. GMY02]|uniref:hypothetical protein n=1 Tax=Streptomyces sp. GMY02 TaxID=1333528 RepID=UPI001C2CB5BA|nr:hypothetical protein [Streptomyces sp. GMY02]QXE36225.1 hypothetical protein KQY30_20230 [Streptomyces sp. GMY02]